MYYGERNEACKVSTTYFSVILSNQDLGILSYVCTYLE